VRVLAHRLAPWARRPRTAADPACACSSGSGLSFCVCGLYPDRPLGGSQMVLVIKLSCFACMERLRRRDINVRLPLHGICPCERHTDARFVIVCRPSSPSPAEGTRRDQTKIESSSKPVGSSRPARPSRPMVGVSEAQASGSLVGLSSVLASCWIARRRGRELCSVVFCRRRPLRSPSTRSPLPSRRRTTLPGRSPRSPRSPLPRPSRQS
jgi:hypothetical protein